MAGKLAAGDVFSRLFEYCGQKPGATVDHPWGEVVFKVKGKIFAYIGRPGESSGVTVKPAPEELEEMLARPNVQLAHYIGRFGWVNVSIDDEPSMKLALRLVDETYEQIANKKKPARKTAPDGDTTAKGAVKAAPAKKRSPAKSAAKHVEDAAPPKKRAAAKKESPAKKAGTKRVRKPPE